MFQTCHEKEAVLHIEQNQVINLTAKYPFRELSGCYYANYLQTTPSKKYTHNIPTSPYRTQTTKYVPDVVTTPSTIDITENASYSEDVAIFTTSSEYNYFTEEITVFSDDNGLDFNYTVEENTVTVS